MIRYQREDNPDGQAMGTTLDQGKSEDQDKIPDPPLSGREDSGPSHDPPPHLMPSQSGEPYNHYQVSYFLCVGLQKTLKQSTLLVFLLNSCW